MKKVVILILIIFLVPINVNAQKGCCSWHGGVVGCSEDGRQMCADGTLSPSCTCTPSISNSRTYETVPEPTYIYGCTDSNAINYNSNATKDDGSCIARKNGCMDSSALNYDATANTDDNSCQYQKTITEEESINYKTTYKDNSELTKDSTKTIQNGKNGKKEVTYNTIVDSEGNVISKEKVEEKVITEPVNEIIERGTNKHQEKNSYLGLLCFIIALITLIWYTSKHKNNNLLWNKIKKYNKTKRIALYIIYFIIVIPLFIDFVHIIINIIKSKIMSSKQK